ncbi:MAG: hypothetical protein WC622_06115 [Pedobacter sp.]|uniref:hypothetical protein n=1 Tax=Pedobacter sp. TaxID=1411316 RepID=UPI0035631A9A
MSRIYPKLILTFLLVVIQLTVKAQVLKNVQNSFDAYYQNVFQEKIFVHTDKEQYLAGELLWFKIYNVDASTNKPVDLSKVTYVELLDQNNNPVLQSKVLLKNGSGNGSLSIPITSTSGSYKFRAYTNWIQNFGANLFFEKKIILINALNPIENQKKIRTDVDVQFFPEGGDMVEGLSCNVGFKALGSDGKGVSLKGVIVDQKNDTVARFQTFKFGMGKFAFTPLANHTYRAIVSGANNTIITKTLPTPKKLGYTLSLVDGEVITLTIGTNLQDRKVYLFVHNGSKIAIAETADIVNGKATFQLNKQQLGVGLSHLTLFNENAQAVCERLYFKKPNQQLKIETHSDSQQYDSRKKVSINLSVKNEKQEVISANLSIAVRKLDSLQGMDQNNIVSYFWLNSELKGSIESPGYYFLENNSDNTIALDNLLLTQGWRRFTWSDVLNNKMPQFKFLPELNGHLINGKLTDKNGSAVKDKAIYLGVPGSRVQFYESRSNANGHFVFNTKKFNGINELVVQTNSNADTTSIISILSPFSEQYTTFDFPDFQVKANLLDELKAYSLGVQIQNVYSRNKLNQFNNPIVDTTRFYGKPFKTYRLNDYTRFRTLEETLREYVTETFISKSQGNFQVRLLGKDVSLNGDPLVLLDGVPYFNMNKVMDIDPNKIEKLEIVPEVYNYGSSKFDGIINLTSFKSNLANIEINPNALVLDYEGLQLQREFYSPSYETASQFNSRIPDFRNVLYWSPSINIDKNGHGELNFYTSDFAGTYIGIINGLSNDGTPGVGTFTFQIREK